MKGNLEFGIQRGEEAKKGELRMKGNSEFMGGKAKKGEVRKLRAGRRDWGNEEFVILYVYFAIKSAIL